MLELRLILLLIGVVFIAAVYLLSRQGKTRSGKSSRKDPVMTASEVPDVPVDPALDREPESLSADAGNQASAADSRQLIVCLHVANRSQQGFAARQSSSLADRWTAIWPVRGIPPFNQHRITAIGV